jgi:two-component system, NarL family, nitrate/nitrite response regulator NarL
VILAGDVSKADLITAVQLGVHGLVLKNAPTELLFQAIVSVIAGQYWVSQTLVAELLAVVRSLGAPAVQDAPRGRAATLTRREREVLALVVAGYANKEIAQTFSISEETIKHHLTRMFDKVGATNRLELAVVAAERGLVSDS